MPSHRNSCIVNIASTAGLRAAGLMSSYGASKAGLIHLAQILAVELAAQGIRVNTIAQVISRPTCTPPLQVAELRTAC